MLPQLDNELDTSNDVILANTLVAKGDRMAAQARLETLSKGVQSMANLMQTPQLRLKTDAKSKACGILRAFLDTEVRFFSAPGLVWEASDGGPAPRRNCALQVPVEVCVACIAWVVRAS
jgi:hypothetical protein